MPIIQHSVPTIGTQIQYEMGSMGATGPMGPTGPRGERGPAGPAGAYGARGTPGTNGVDGVNGEDGIFREFVWQRAAVVPDTPTGNGIPTGWFDDPPLGVDPLWMSVAKQELDGTLIDEWSTPIRHDGPQGEQGPAGVQGTPGERGSKQFYASTEGTAWSDSEANAVIAAEGLVNVLLDAVTLYNSAEGFAQTKFWDGSTWVAITQVIDGNLLVNGTVLANKLAVTELSAIAANVGTVTAGLLQNTAGTASFDLNNSRILFNNGSVMKVSGLGFGSSNQFIEWCGPSQTSLSLCTEANALSYIKIDGSGYFGGSLSAGVLSNSIQTSDTSSTAQITLGPFGTNGNPKVVTLSYTYAASYIGTDAPPLSLSFSASIQLYRKIGSASEALVATLVVPSDVYSREYDSESGNWLAEQHAGGSLTFTDSVAGTDNRAFRAVISSMTDNLVLYVSCDITQRISITSIEE